MRIGMPIEADQGPDSPICAHFGSAPAFLIADTEQGTFQSLSNDHGHDGHGQCVPVDLLRGQRLDMMVVSGIGRGAILKLSALGVRVHRAEGATAREAIAAVLASTSSELEVDMACSGHHHGHTGH